MKRVQRIAILAWLDWVMFLLFTFPLALVLPFVMVGAGADLLPTATRAVLECVVLLGLCAVVAMAVDRLRGTRGIRQVNDQQAQSLSRALMAAGLEVDSSVVRALRVNAGDLSAGAHVRGVLKPYLVISGGMYVGLSRGDGRAIGMFCHEVGHVRHGDRILLAVLGLSVLELGRRLVVAVLDPSVPIFLLLLYSALAIGVICMVLSRCREYYADAAALAMCPDRAAYEEMLSHSAHASEERFSFFHPSRSRRVAAIHDDYRTIRRALFWRAFWPLNALISWFQYFLARYHELPGVENYYYSMVACLWAWAFVLFIRPFLTGALKATVVPVPAVNPTTARDQAVAQSAASNAEGSSALPDGPPSSGRAATTRSSGN